jgi:hypothetical protein
VSPKAESAASWADVLIFWRPDLRGQYFWAAQGRLLTGGLVNKTGQRHAARTLAVVARRDQEFRAKARSRFYLALPRHRTVNTGGHSGLLNVAKCHGLPVPPNDGAVTCGRCLASDAIAREEGRAP